MGCSDLRGARRRTFFRRSWTDGLPSQILLAIILYTTTATELNLALSPNETQKFSTSFSLRGRTMPTSGSGVEPLLTLKTE